MEYISFCREMLEDTGDLEDLSEKDGRKVLKFLEYSARELPSLDEFPIINIPTRAGKGCILYIIGDLHGDLQTAKTIMGNFYKIKAVLRLKKKDNWEVKLLFLGDYIDRAPKDVKNGGFLTLLYLLCAKMIHKEEIFMLRGNHEAIDLLTFAPYELPIEISDIFGEKISEDVHEILMKIFSELPLFLKTGNGLIASHAGFPKDRHKPISGILKDDKTAILQTTWGDPVESETYRGEISKSSRFGQDEVKAFLEDNDSNVFLRGHDHRTMGYEMYGGKMLTIHSSSRYKNRGAKGIQIVRAMVHSKKKIRRVNDIKFLHLEGEKMHAAVPSKLE